MRATTEQRTLWNDYRDKGDIKEISDRSGISRITIGDAMNTGIGTEKIISLINNFYMERKMRIDATMSNPNTSIA